MRAALLVALACSFTLACHARSRDAALTRTGPPALAARCPQPDTGPRHTWRKPVRSSATASLAGRPHHSASDPIVNPGGDVVVRGKFAYGVTSQDLQDEEVGLWLRQAPCGGWREVGRARTDSDGRIALTLSRDHFSSPGAYPYQLIVKGDLSRAHGTIYLLPRRTRVVIFDIDGTLTTDDGEIIEQVALGSEPEVQPDASRVVDFYVAQKYLPIYITGRPYPLRGSTAAWLRRHGFAPGPLITTDRFGDSRPGHHGVGRFKRAVLSRLRRELALDIVAAYGNADSDVCAYSMVGVPPARTFIVGAGPKKCRQYPATRTFTSYRDHLDWLTVEATGP